MQLEPQNNVSMRINITYQSLTSCSFLLASKADDLDFSRLYIWNNLSAACSFASRILVIASLAYNVKLVISLLLRAFDLACANYNKCKLAHVTHLHKGFQTLTIPDLPLDLRHPTQP